MAGSDKWYELRVRVTVGDRESCHARDQVKATRPGGARVHHQPVAISVNQLLVRMAVDDHVGVVPGQKLLRLWAADLVPVADVDAETIEHAIDRLLQPRIAWVITISMDGLNRGDERELVQDIVAAHVTSVKNQIHAGEGPVNFGA